MSEKTSERNDTNEGEGGTEKREKRGKASKAKFTTRLVVFTSKTCGACVMLKKAGTLDAFAKAHPECEVTDLCVADEDGESPDGSEYAKNDELADEYEVTHLPTIVLETPDGGELIRIENPVSMKLPKLEEIYAKQLKLLDAKRARLAGK